MAREFLPHRLRRLRKLSGKSQAEAAAAVGVSQAILSSWELAPNLPQLRALARAYGVPLRELLGEPKEAVSR